MPRNSSGNYTLPAGNPVVPDTLIEASWANPTLSDLAGAITDSLDRYGRGGMLAEFKIADGIVTGPGLAFTSQSNLGLYRHATNVMGIASGGVAVARFSNVGIELLKPLTGALTFDAGATFKNGIDLTSPVGVTALARFAANANPLANAMEVGQLVDATGRVMMLTNTRLALGTNNVERLRIGTDGGAISSYMPLRVDTVNANVELNKQAAGQVALVMGSQAGSYRWSVVLGDGAAETGGNAGSDFVIDRWDDAGNWLDTVMDIARSTGNVIFSKAVTVAGAFNANAGMNVSGAVAVGGSRAVFYDSIDARGTSLFDAINIGQGTKVGLIYRNGVNQLTFRIGDEPAGQFYYVTMDHPNGVYAHRHHASEYFQADGVSNVGGNNPTLAAFRASGPFGGGLGLTDGSTRGGVYTSATGNIHLLAINDSNGTSATLNLNANGTAGAIKFQADTGGGFVWMGADGRWGLHMGTNNSHGGWMKLDTGGSIVFGSDGADRVWITTAGYIFHQQGAIIPRCEAGRATSDGSGNINITFGRAFGDPAITCTVETGAFAGFAQVTSRTGSTFQARVFDNTGAVRTNTPVLWVAVERTQ